MADRRALARCIAAVCDTVRIETSSPEKGFMRTFVRAGFVVASCVAAAIGSGVPAMAGQSFLYPPEVRIRPVVAVPDPYLQRHYWDPRICDLHGTAAPRRWHCWRDGLSR
jgi:hypothetical protein